MSEADQEMIIVGAIRKDGGDEQVSLAAFKVPHSVVQRRKKKVLQEDDYVARMESIIERDFFPDLTDLQARAAYSQAVEDRDVPRIRELYEKMGGGGRVDGSYRSSPATFETPVRHDRSPSGSTSTSITDSERQRQQSVLLQSLDEFLEKHTSEDNESFEEMMDEAKRKHRIKYSWMYDAESTSRLQQEVQLSLPSCERQALDDSKPALVNSWSYTARNSIMYVPDGAPLTDQERARMQLDKEHIQHCRTRFEASPFDESQSREAVRQAARLQTNSRHGQVDVDGKEIKRTGTPAVNGFNLVRTPSPAPGVDSTPLMTWGEIDSTPFRLDAGDATPLPAGVTASGPSFHLQDVPERDRIGLKLAEKVGRGYRDRRGRSRHQQSPSPAAAAGAASPAGKYSATMSRAMASMSPAARRLATSRLGIRLSSDNALQASYTPDRAPFSTPRQGGSTPRTPSTSSSSSSKRSRATPSGAAANLTDNLLQLPKRT